VSENENEPLGKSGERGCHLLNCTGLVLRTTEIKILWLRELEAEWRGPWSQRVEAQVSLHHLTEKRAFWVLLAVGRWGKKAGYFQTHPWRTERFPRNHPDDIWWTSYLEEGGHAFLLLMGSRARDERLRHRVLSLSISWRPLCIIFKAKGWQTGTSLCLKDFTRSWDNGEDPSSGILLQKLLSHSPSRWTWWMPRQYGVCKEQHKGNLIFLRWDGVPCSQWLCSVPVHESLALGHSVF
jgi:hypothetical protein